MENFQPAVTMLSGWTNTWKNTRPIRYAIACCQCTRDKDADFSWKEFQQRNNNELADILGNFVNRSLTFLQKNFNNKIPEPGKFDNLDKEMLFRLAKAPEEIGNS